MSPSVNQRTVKPLPLRNGGVIGAGTMGTGIAMSMLNAGIPVLLIEQNKEVKCFIGVNFNIHRQAIAHH